MVNLLKKLYLKAAKISWLVIVVFTLSLIAGSVFFLQLIEPDTFTNSFDTLWFVMTTILTVGYGDMFPVTFFGKLYVIIVLYVLGIGLFATFIGKLLDSIMYYRAKKVGGELHYKKDGHVVIVDWSHKSKVAIDKLLGDSRFKSDIVVIDDIEKLEHPNHRVHYVKGEVTTESALRKANIQKAKTVLIFSDDRIENPVLRDGKSLMIACAVERVARDVKTIVEVEFEHHLQNFSHVNVDEFIVSNKTIANMLIEKMN